MKSDLQKQVDRLRKALDAATDVGIYPEAIMGGGPDAYEKRTEFMEGWNGHALAAIKEVQKALQPGDWDEMDLKPPHGELRTCPSCGETFDATNDGHTCA